MRVILFNLAPYRQQREILNRTIFYVELLVTFSISILLCWAISDALSEKITAKQEYLNRIHALQSTVANRIAEMEKVKSKLVVLRGQVAILRSIESDSRFSSELLSVIDKTIPQGVALNQISVSRSKVSLIGRTDNLNVLAKWVDYLKSFHETYSDAALVSVNLVRSSKTDKSEPNSNDAVHDFELQLDVAVPSLDFDLKDEGR
ncbi:MAG TPA: PilN domain-containing protein [Limnobacter sp.]|uniref:PilN domain-containing protein n=1 Tax=Limnobacter sp. TaxID=2003368 RepID=UPI002E3634C3|nr:PilN domain-containing protein [Limnobacter sp.]HEX5486726.1 PilN domain-containing protein [Limnobacter sp.]